MTHSHRSMIIIMCTVLLLAVAGAAQAATANGINRIVSVRDDYQGYPNTILTIAEEADNLDSLVAGESFELRLPEGVKWYEDEITGMTSFQSEDIDCQNCTVEAKLHGDRLIGITIVEADPAALSRLKIPIVFQVDGYLGDVEVTIDPIDSSISGGSYLFARVPYKLVPVPTPEPDPEPAPQPTRQQAVFTIGSPYYSIDGESQPEMDVKPYIKEGRTYLPVRFVAYSLGIDEKNIQWDEQSRKVTLSKAGHTLQLQIGSRTLTHNGAAMSMDVAPEILGERTMLPVAPVVEAMGGSVKWDPVLRTVTIVMESTSQGS